MGRWWVVGLVVVGCGDSEAVLRGRGVFIEPDTGLYVADHDVALETLDEALSLEQGLTVAQFKGRDDVWPLRQREHLTYCIDMAAFGLAAPHVERALTEAIEDWESSAHVRFVHLRAEDAKCTRENSNVVFDVRPVRQRSYLARAFFPNQRRSMRELLIDSSAIPPPRPWSLTGVLRHELGHVLGLRHEHTRSRSNPCFEDLRWRAATAYDSRSVMHYPQCEGADSGDLVLSPLDRSGIATLYP
jgi:hypothetical protein